MFGPSLENSYRRLANGNLTLFFAPARKMTPGGSKSTILNEFRPSPENAPRGLENSNPEQCLAPVWKIAQEDRKRLIETIFGPGPENCPREECPEGAGEFSGAWRIAARARGTQPRPAGPSLPKSKRDQIEPAEPLLCRTSPGRLTVTHPQSPDLVLSWPLTGTGAAHLCQMPADRR